VANQGCQQGTQAPGEQCKDVSTRDDFPVLMHRVYMGCCRPHTPGDLLALPSSWRILTDACSMTARSLDNPQMRLAKLPLFQQVLLLAEGAAALVILAPHIRHSQRIGQVGQADRIEAIARW
jgi:hypothetical protein